MQLVTPFAPAVFARRAGKYHNRSIGSKANSEGAFPSMSCIEKTVGLWEAGCAFSFRAGPRANPDIAREATYFAPGMIEVISLRLAEETAPLGVLLKRLSSEEQLRAGRFVFERDCRRFVIGRVRLRELLAERLNERPEAIELTYGPRGKPALAPRLAKSGLHFNLSHAEDVAVYAFAFGLEVGVDVEAVRELRDADEIAKRFFSRHERGAYFALDPHDRLQGFFNCWTRKEAFIKAVGDGLFRPLDSFDVSVAPGIPAEILRVGDTPGERCGWQIESFSPAPGFVAAVVSADPERAIPGLRNSRSAARSHRAKAGTDARAF